MRIRKHAKISPLVYAASSLKPGTVIQTHVCQLNQSPWDVMNFPPSTETATPPPPPLLGYLVDKDDSYMANGTFAEYIGADKSAASLKYDLDDEKEKWDDMSIPAAESFDDGGAEAEKDDHSRFKKNGDGILCCKSDGKGWQCRRKAKEGHSLCEHHSSQLRSCNNLANPATKKSEMASSENRRRARPKKPPSSNPHEFYYYSGFGPRWGKKRGLTRKPEPYASASSASSDTSKNILEFYEPNTPEPSSIPGYPSSQIRNEGFDYVEDEEEDDDDSGETGKKRARKPIKARSLKSLM